MGEVGERFHPWQMADMSGPQTGRGEGVTIVTRCEWIWLGRRPFVLRPQIKHGCGLINDMESM